MIEPHHRLALLMHGHLADRHGKMGFSLLRYKPEQVVAVVDEDHAGVADLRDITGIVHSAPVVADVAAALALGADVVVVAVATTGGVLPGRYRSELAVALRAGASVVHPLHGRLAEDPELGPLVRPGAWIWDLRVEPPGLVPGAGRAATLPGIRVLTVGADMAIGKMTAGIELDAAARRRGYRSRFLATGQIGICLTGAGVALDAVRVDFASGAVERLVLGNAEGHDLLWVEGQGSVLHPASTAWLPLLRGACPTHLVLVHRAGQSHVDRFPDVPIPPLRDVAALYESVSRAGGAFPGAITAGIALNTAGLDDGAARLAVESAERESGLPCTDVVRFGADRLLDAVTAGRISGHAR